MSNATFTPVLGGASSEQANQGKLNIVRPSELAKSEFTGLVVEGIYEGSVANKFDETKLDYKVRSENGDLTIINETGSLRRQMNEVSIGTLIQIEYQGKVKITKGALAGKSAHRFTVLKATDAE